MTDIMLERETANDESATVVAVHAASGAWVEKDEVLFDIENSKATQEVVAPEAGTLTHDLKIGHPVLFGVPIAQIAPTPAPDRDPAADRPGMQDDRRAVSSAVGYAPQLTLPPLERAAPSAAPAQPPQPEPRFSRAATDLILEHGLASAQFDSGFVTAKDVRALLEPHKLQPAPPKPLPAPEAGVGVTAAASQGPHAGKALAARKRAEIDVLSKGAGGTMLSVLGTSLGTLTIERDPDDFLQGRITDLVIYEASRLMRKFPRLNAHYADGQVFHHGAVHAGLAIDDGGQLVVYGIEDADRLSLRGLSDTIGDAVARYANNALTSAELSRATFTVTDLSADELDFVLPLLPRGQSCILGITQSAQAGFRIFAGFDHRVTEGREVAMFLGELRDRLRSFGSIERPGIRAACCAYCGRSAAEAVTRSKEKGLLKIVDREGCDALCCASCWNGW